MSAFFTNLKLVPSQAGSIAPSTFVTIDGTQGDNMCRQATGTGDIPIGISQVGYDVAPGLSQLFPGASITQVAAVAGEPLGIFTNGDVCGMVVGSLPITPGTLLGPDSQGRAVAVTPGSGNWYGAIATSAANAGDIVDVYKWLGKA